MSEGRLDPLVWLARSKLPGIPRTLGEAGAATSETRLDPLVWLARSDSPGDPRMLGEASAATSEARFDPLAWEERRRRRARDVGYAAVCSAALFYRRWHWICPSLRLLPPDPDDMSVSVRQWKFNLRQHRVELAVFRRLLLTMACSWPH